MNIEQNILEKLRKLPLVKQQQLLDFANFLDRSKTWDIHNDNRLQ
ncbi:MAG: hypothetical protein ACRC80_34610 [Waterburya sp.]